MLKNRVNGCHGNHAFFHSAIEFIFEDKNSLCFWGPNERFGTHEKLSWGGGGVGCKVGQISSRGMLTRSAEFWHFGIFQFFSLKATNNLCAIEECYKKRVLLNVVLRSILN